MVKYILIEWRFYGSTCNFLINRIVKQAIFTYYVLSQFLMSEYPHQKELVVVFTISVFFAGRKE